MKLICALWVFIVILETNAKLYNDKDNVMSFDKQSFESTFYNLSANNWFIQFYHSYCGHCQNFAPTFKLFLKEAQYWNWTINFGVVDCSEEKALCTDQHIMYYPFFKIYPNNSYNISSKNGTTVKLQHNYLANVYDGIIALIETYFSPEPLLETKDVQSIPEGQYLMVSGNNMVDLKRTILTFYSRLKYKLYYQLMENSSNYNLKFSNNGDLQSFDFANLSELFSGLNRFLTITSNNDDISTQIMTTTLSSSKPNNQFSTFPVYNQDIYASIVYSFLNDVDDDKVTTVENINILNNFIRQLYQYSNLNGKIMGSFKRISKLLDEKADSLLKRKKFTKSWSRILNLSKFPMKQENWIGCNGSEPQFRRYPCGLWTTFHVMTVNKYLKDQRGEDNGEVTGPDLIDAIRQFIFTFFSCGSCAENFKIETIDYKEQVNNSKDAVLYLWKVHNSVNKRLAKKPSEDPMFPKIAFPPLSTCGKCRNNYKTIWPNNQQWMSKYVLKYLIRHYSNMNIVPFQTDSSLLIQNSTWSLTNISSIDISVCLMLSLCSSFIVILAFIKFFKDSSFFRRRKFSRKLPV